MINSGFLVRLILEIVAPIFVLFLLYWIIRLAYRRSWPPGRGVRRNGPSPRVQMSA